MAKHTVLFVGRFDPPHINHVRTASALLRRAEVEALWVFPLAGSGNEEHVRNMCTILCSDMSLGGEKPTCCTAGLDKGLETVTGAWEWARKHFPAIEFKMAMLQSEFDEDSTGYCIRVGAGKATNKNAVVLNYPPIPIDLVERIKGGSDESRNFSAPVWTYVQRHRLYRN